MNTPNQKRRTAPPVAQDKCTAFGLDRICDMIVAGETLTGIAAQVGVHVSSLLTWGEADPQRSARMREARHLAGRIWDEKAEMGILLAADPFELSRAKELAHHYRWRAKAVAPKEYGDKVTTEHTGKDGGPIALAAIDLKGMSDAELAQMQALLSKAAAGGGGGV